MAAARPLLPQHDSAALVLAHEVERVLADIDSDDAGGCGVVLAGHRALLLFAAPCQRRSLAGPEHGRTIPLPDIPPGRKPSTVRLVQSKIFRIDS